MPIDPVWSRVCEEALAAVANEPLMGGLVHSSLLHHATMERALAYRFSLKLASGEMGEQLLREIAEEAYSTDPQLGLAARADLVAVYDRDPACHRYLQPMMFFKGYQA
ncbi:MAG: serine O-acetyltransferase, partial [Gemmobacter sp.]